jgi:hypothetical protein
MLLDENWVDEDILNGMAELLYFQLAAALPDTAPGFLFLPTSFFNDARHLYYAQTPRIFSQNFVALRDRLHNSDVQSMGFIVWHNNHYAAYFYKRSESAWLLHSDSQGLKPAPDVLEIFSWLLSGLSNYPIPQYIQEGARALQSVGSGSCGIAAHNFVESLANHSVPYWDDLTSPVFRQKALREMIVYHGVATEKTQMVCAMA